MSWRHIGRTGLVVLACMGMAACAERDRRGLIEPQPEPTLPSVPSFDISFSSPELSLVQGHNGGLLVRVIRRGGFTGSVSLALSGLPPGVTGTLSPDQLAVGDASSTLALSAADTAVTGNYSVVIHGTGAGVDSRTGSLALELHPGVFAPVAFRAASITAGGHHSCAIQPDGAAHCWGAGGYLQLGTGDDVADRPYPTRVAGGARFASLSAGARHTCGLAVTGEAYCWGNNRNGGLGDGTKEFRSVPTRVAGGLHFRQLISGHSAQAAGTCGLEEGGAVYCWGSYILNPLGEDVLPGMRSTVPIEVSAGHTFERIALGLHHICGLTTDGTAMCWGYSSLTGGSTAHFGNGVEALAIETPVAVGGDHVFRDIAAGAEHTCGVTTNDRVLCWGLNLDGNVGDGTRSPRPLPVEVDGVSDAASVIAIARSTCALTRTGTAYCWGVGPLGDGSTFVSSSTLPQPVAGGIPFSMISGSANHACGLGTDGIVYCWGLNVAGELGDGTTLHRGVPAQVRTITMQ